MRKILLLITLFIVLLGGIIYIISTGDYKEKDGIVIQPPFNQLERRYIFELEHDLKRAYYYVDNSNKYDFRFFNVDDSIQDNYRFFTLNVSDLSYLFTERGVKDEVYYKSYLKSTLRRIPDDSWPYRRLVKGAPAVLYYYQRDMGDSLFIPTKVAVICCNKKLTNWKHRLYTMSINGLTKWNRPSLLKTLKNIGEAP